MIRLGKLSAMLAGFLILGPALGWADTTSSSVNEWGGLYIGGNIGWVGARPDTNTTTTFDPTGYLNVPSDEDDVRQIGDQHLISDDFTGGGQIGYNWQSGPWVLGLETDFNALNATNGRTRTSPWKSAPTAIVTASSTTRTDWLFTARTRLGLAQDRWMVYGTGGLTVADLEAEFTLSDNFSPMSERQNLSKVKPGWTVGGGAEVSLDKNWSFRTEYLYANLGTLEGNSREMTFGVAGATATELHHEAEFVIHLVRCSLNYKF